MGNSSISLSSVPVFDRNRLPEPGAEYSTGALFLLDKPAGWTSFDAVKFLRGRIRTKKTGHAGTLDPLATGLLILCAGKATKLVSQIQELPKRYLAEVKLGASTPSQDAATPPEEHAPYDHVDLSQVETLLARQFTGPISQVPPMYSALWKDGKRLYTLARKGQVVDREPRTVEVYDSRVVRFDDDRFILDLLCSKGTYVRTLAHDLGLALDTRAHLSSLRRTAIGPYLVDDAADVERIRSLYEEKA
ncbi:MAG: tRNA pseudouridine(55) synthase TruB [Cyclonatronaceae bacterium]